MDNAPLRQSPSLLALWRFIARHAVADANHPCAAALNQNTHRRDPRGGWTGLMLAAKVAHVALVQLLLGEGADPCAANEFKATALHWVGANAERRGHWAADCIGQNNQAQSYARCT